MSKRSKMGGEVIESGGFGCIFKPALKCINEIRPSSGISKMSLLKNSKQEIEEINKIKKNLSSIKNYKDYFLLDVNSCTPDKLTSEDLKKFNDKCYALKKENLNESNINNHLEKVKILNMPDGGIDLRKWLVQENKIKKEKIFLLNKLIIKLIKYGIRPMNEKKVIHNDLKDNNVLIDSKLNCRIIDWGLSAIVNGNKIPNKIRNRPLQYNTAFSSMILSNEFKINYEIFLDRIKKKEFAFNFSNVRNYVVNEYLIKLAKYYGYYDDNVALFDKIFSPAISSETFLSQVKREDLIEYGYYLYYLSNYITEILMTYTSNQYIFNVDKYFMDCYLFNSDIFGIMTIYYNFFDIPYENIDLSSGVKSKYMNQIKSLLIENIFTQGDKRINIKKLINDIKKLDKILKEEKHSNLHNKTRISFKISKDSKTNTRSTRKSKNTRNTRNTRKTRNTIKMDKTISKNKTQKSNSIRIL